MQGFTLSCLSEIERLIAEDMPDEHVGSVQRSFTRIMTQVDVPFALINDFNQASTTFRVIAKEQKDGI